MSSSSTETASVVDVTMPQMGVSVAEGTVVAWRVEPGDRIEAEQTICEISTDKIDTEVPAPVSGVVTEIIVPVETTVAVGEVLARIALDGSEAPAGGASPAAPERRSARCSAAETTAEPAPETATAPAPRAPAPPADGDGRGNGRRYSPVVQRIAAEHGVDLSQVPGTGRAGRVRKQDVMAFIESGRAARR